MLRVCLLIIVVGLSHEQSTVQTENKTREQVYYKRTEHLALSAKDSSVKRDNATTIEQSLAADKPRKRVLLDENKTLLLDSLAVKPVEEKTDEITLATKSNKPLDMVKASSTTDKPWSSTVRATPVQEKQEAKNPTRPTTKATKKVNPKPTVTYAEEEAADESMPHFPTSKTLLGMPRKIDYIVPVIITITALPLLGAAFYVLYKRGRDYWDKRHYRRMDFLIDGMYNE